MRRNAHTWMNWVMLIWCPILHSLAHDEAQTLFGYRMDLYLPSLCAFWDLSTACMTTDIRGAVGGQVSPPCTSIFHSGCRVFFTGPYGLYNPYVLMPMHGPINKIKTKFLVKTVLRHPSNFMCGTSYVFLFYQPHGDSTQSPHAKRCLPVFLCGGYKPK